MDQYSLIIALGAGLENKKLEDPPYCWIGQETKLRVKAAATLTKQNPHAFLLFSGGRLAGAGTPSEAEAMQSYIGRPPWNVPTERILTENDSIDTASNVRSVAAIIHTRGLPTENVILIAGRAQCARAVAYFRAYGIKVSATSAREVLGLVDVSDAQSVLCLFKAFLLRLEQRVDRRGLLVTRFKQWQMNRRKNPASAPSLSGETSSGAGKL